MGIPTITAAATLKTYHLYQVWDLQLLGIALLGASVAFLTGLGAIFFMMRWLYTGTFLPFVIYRIVLGVILLSQ